LNFSIYIAKRYLFSKSKNNAINIITGIASVGIIVGTMALFVVLSVFSGLRDFSLSFSNDFDADLKVIPHVGKSFFISSKQENQLKNLKDIASFSKVVEERVLFFFDGKEQVTYLKGVDANLLKQIYCRKTTFSMANG
jgi:lipoprotein-releasing system permease protein